MNKLWAALRRQDDRVVLQVSTPKNGGLNVTGPAKDVLELAKWWEQSRPTDGTDEKPKMGFQKVD